MKMLVSYLDNPPEEAIADSSQIKEKNGTIKLAHEEVKMFNQKHLKSFDNEVSRPEDENFFISGKFCKNTLDQIYIKFCAEDEFLITLMKLRLELLSYYRSFSKFWNILGGPCN